MYTHAHIHDLAGQMLAQTSTGTAPQQQPVVTQQPAIGTAPGAAAVGGAVLLALCLVAFIAGKWGKAPKPQRTWFILGFIVATLLAGSAGIIGMVSTTVRTTGDQLGNTVTNTTTGR
ncbi:hypothetical protein ACIBSV_12165 [Embleya sp. NPDC050154]|uniref:hypothetical protein n=1 Tax=Embleya sp. NPDC050154 TaxID=3363988 RepID=UPI0037B301B2